MSSPEEEEQEEEQEEEEEEEQEQEEEEQQQRGALLEPAFATRDAAKKYYITPLCICAIGTNSETKFC